MPTDRTIQRINGTTFLTALATIAIGVAIGVLGVWEIIPIENGLLARLLASDAIVFAGAVLTNLAIGCYRRPGGGVA